MSTTNSIGTSSRDYSTLQAWEDAVPATPTGGYVGECYNDSEFIHSCIVSGHTTSAANYIKLTTAAGQSFMDDAGYATNPLVYDKTKGVAITSGDGDYAQGVIYTDNDYVTFEKLQVKRTGGYYGPPVARLDYPVTSAVIQNCIIAHPYNVAVRIVWLYGGKFINNVVYSTGGNSGTYACRMYGAETVNNTFIDASGGHASRAFEFMYGGGVFTNNAAFGWNDLYGSPPSGATYNATDDATGFPGTGNVNSLTFANQFVSTTTDFRPKAGNSLQVGTRDAANTHDLDIVGVARSTSTPTIGAREYASSSNVTTALTGASATFSAGNLLDADSGSLSGQAASFSGGSLGTWNVTIGLSGQSATFAAGTVTPGVAQDVTTALTGASATFAAGTLAPGVSQAVTGQSATFAAGTVTPGVTQDVTTALTGASAAFASGTIVASGGDVADSHDPGYQVVRESDHKKRLEELQGRRKPRILPGEAIATVRLSPEKLQPVGRLLRQPLGNDDEDVLLVLSLAEGEVTQAIAELALSITTH